MYETKVKEIYPEARSNYIRSDDDWYIVIDNKCIGCSSISEARAWKDAYTNLINENKIFTTNESGK